MWVNRVMVRRALSRLSPEEKDALILALLDRVAALEAKLGQRPKTPGNSSVPPWRGRKANRPPRPKRTVLHGGLPSRLRLRHPAFQAIRTDFGRPNSSIRFKAAAAMATEVASFSSVRDRRASPITRL